MQGIHPEMKIAAILESYPEALAVFTANGFPATDKADLLQQVGPLLTLKTALKLKGINQEVFLGLLTEKLMESQLLPAGDDEPSAKRLNFLGYTYCPLKLIFKECFDELRRKYQWENKDKDFHSFVPSGCGEEEDPYRANIWQVADINDFPDIAVSAGFGDFFRQEFVERFVNRGYFKYAGGGAIHADFSSADYEDPAGWYTMYSALPSVMLVDHKRLGDLPVPRQWSDLLNPVYKNNIIIGASHGDFHEDLLLYIHKEHGDEGLRKLAANFKNGMHGAEMSKIAGTASAQGAAIYVIAWLFAKACPRTESTSIVWPVDGALITPMFLLIKDGVRADLQPFIDFVTGPAYGQKSADNYFPVLHPQVDNKLPAGAGFKWLGWEHIRSHSMDELKEHVVSTFKQALSQGVN